MSQSREEYKDKQRVAAKERYERNKSIPGYMEHRAFRQRINSRNRKERTIKFPREPSAKQAKQAMGYLREVASAVTAAAKGATATAETGKIVATHHFGQQQAQGHQQEEQAEETQREEAVEEEGEVVEEEVEQQSVPQLEEEPLEEEKEATCQCEHEPAARPYYVPRPKVLEVCCCHANLCLEVTRSLESRMRSSGIGHQKMGLGERIGVLRKKGHRLPPIAWNALDDINKARKAIAHYEGSSIPDVRQFIQAAELVYPILDRELGGPGVQLIVKLGKDFGMRACGGNEQLEKEVEMTAYLDYWLHQAEEKSRQDEEKSRRAEEKSRRAEERMVEMQEEMDRLRQERNGWADRSDYFEAEARARGYVDPPTRGHDPKRGYEVVDHGCDDNWEGTVSKRARRS